MTLLTNTTLIPGTTIVTDSITGGVAIDYSSYFARIATAVETLAANTNTTVVLRVTNGITANNVSLYNALTTGDVITFTSEQQGLRLGLVVLGENVPAGTIIIKLYTSTVIVPNVGPVTYYHYQLSNQLTSFGTSQSFLCLDSTTSIAKDINVINSSVSSINDTVLTGVRTFNPYDLIGTASMYSYYASHPTELDTLLANLPTVPNAVLDQLKALLQPVTKL